MTAPLPEHNFEDLWDARRACAFLCCGKTWLYAACARGEVPHVRLGSNVRFIPDVLRKWVATTASRGPGAPTVAVLYPFGAKR